MRYTYKRLYVLFSSIVLFIFFQTQWVQANQPFGLHYEVENETRTEIYEGITHIHSSALITNDAASRQRQNVNVLIKDVDANQVQLVSWAKFVNGQWRLAPLHEIAADFESKNPGWKVIAGINGDFFTVNGSINMHMTHYGDLFKSRNSYFTVGISEDGRQIDAVTNLEYGSYYITAYDPETYEILLVKEIQDVNLKEYDTHLTTVLHNLGTIELSGFNMYLVESPEAITNFNHELFLKGKISTATIDSAHTTSSNFAIATNEDDVIEVLNQQPIVRIQRIVHSDFYTFDTAIGGNLPILRHNRILSVDEMLEVGSSKQFITARHPRTSIGITADGDLVLGIIDGRQSSAPAGFESHGVDLRELALMMKQFGAVDAYNLDGGGSSQMIVRNDAGEFEYVNSPSEGPHILPIYNYRSDANGLLLVVPDVSVRTSYENLSLAGLDLTYSLHPNEGIEIISADVSINGIKKPLANNQGTLHLTELNSGINYFNFIVTYKKDDIEFTRSYAHKVFDLSKNISPTKPTFDVQFDYDKETSKLNLAIHVTDPDKVIQTVKVIYDEYWPPIKATIQNNMASISLNQPIPREYIFRIAYTDKRAVEILYEKTFTYTVEESTEKEPDKDENKWIIPLIIGLGIVISFISIGIIVRIVRKNKP